MRKVLIGVVLALIAAVVWLGSGPRPTTTEEQPKIAQSKTAQISSVPAGSQVTDAVKSDTDPQASASAPQRPANWAAAPPQPTGSAGRGSLQSNSRAVEGTIERLSGAMQVYNIPKETYRDGADSLLELSVEKGVIRAYLQYFPDTGGFFKHQDGYVFAQAEPGKPGKVEGFLAWGGGSGENETYAVTFESVGGDAEGVRYKITPRK